MSKLNNKNVGLACTVLGGIFFLAGVVLFILYNSVNLYAQKADATIVSRYAVESLDLVIYYNVKNPKEILDAGWHFEMIIPALFGVLILLTGLYYMGIISFGLEPAKKPGDSASDWDKKYYAARERAENALIPLLGVISFIVFGIFMVVNKSGWWAWIFVGVGVLGVVYLLTDLIPAAKEFFALRRVKKYKVKTLSVDDDFEEFERKQKEVKGKKKETDKKDINKDSQDTDKETEIPKEYEVEDTFEIKSLDTHKKKKRK